jgi:hypothetical protein
MPVNRASQIHDLILESPVLTVEPGFIVDARTSYGIHDESDDLALSIEWRDSEGCLWSSDFFESALALAELQDATVSLRDTQGAHIVLRRYEPAMQPAFAPH